MAKPTVLEWRAKTHALGADELVVLKAGKGEPLLLHAELGFPGPQSWQGKIAKKRKLLAPRYPGFVRAPGIERLAIAPATARIPPRSSCSAS